MAEEVQERRLELALRDASADLSLREDPAERTDATAAVRRERRDVTRGADFVTTR